MRLNLFPALAILAIAPAHAGYSLTIPLELQADFIETRVSGEDASGSDVYATIEPDLRVEATDWLAFNLGATIEPVLDPDDNHRLLEDHGLFVRNLNVEFASGPLTLTLGKFSARFGIGYEEVPGVYGDTLNADIEVAERLGASLAWRFEGQNDDAYTVTAGVFRTDTSFLSNSVFTERGRVLDADGEPGNTDGLENYSLAFDAENAFGASGLLLHGGVLSLQHDDEGDRHVAFAVGARWEIELDNGAVVTPLVEYFQSDGATLPGTDELGDGDQSVLTLGGSYVAGPWNVALVYGRSEIDAGLMGDLSEHTDFAQVSVGYAFENGIGVDIGYLYGETRLSGGGFDEDVEVESLGLLLSYEFSAGDL
jgi:hypothetical protein